MINLDPVRWASALGTDAGMNLVNALRVAGCADARGKGVLVTMNDEIGDSPSIGRMMVRSTKAPNAPDTNNAPGMASHTGKPMPTLNANKM